MGIVVAVRFAGFSICAPRLEGLMIWVVVNIRVPF